MSSKNPDARPRRHLGDLLRACRIPSQALLLRLAQALDVPLEHRNALLLAAGYVPVYDDSAWNALEVCSAHMAAGADDATRSASTEN